MAIVNGSHRLESFLEQLAKLHKHVCPRQVLGVRMGLYAAELLGTEIPQENKRLLTFVETDGCFADGVGVVTGCSMGHRTMRLVDYGKVAATFVDTHDGRALRCWPSPSVRLRAAAFVPAKENRWQAQLVAYQQMPSEQLLQVREVTFTFDLGAIVGKPGTRTTCSTCDEEIINQREVVKNGKLVCRSCAGESYWSLTSS
jgi:formylmethanofuran dehydrogenase subunit E